MPDWYCEWQVWGTNTRSPRQGRTAGVGSVKGPSLGRTGTSEMRRFWPFAGTAIHPTGPRLAVIRRCSSNRPDREQHGGRCHSRYNRVEGMVRRGSEVSPMPKSTFTDRNRSLPTFDASSPSAEPTGMTRSLSRSRLVGCCRSSTCRPVSSRRSSKAIDRPIDGRPDEEA